MRSINVVVALLFGYFVAAVSSDNGNDYVVSDKIDAGACARGGVCARPSPSMPPSDGRNEKRGRCAHLLPGYVYQSALTRSSPVETCACDRALVALCARVFVCLRTLRKERAIVRASSRLRRPRRPARALRFSLLR